MMRKYVSLNRLSNFKDKIIELIPIKLSDLENDCGFIDSGIVEIISDTEPTDQNENDYWLQEY